MSITWPKKSQNKPNAFNSDSVTSFLSMFPKIIYHMNITLNSLDLSKRMTYPLCKKLFMQYTKFTNRE